MVSVMLLLLWKSKLVPRDHVFFWHFFFVGTILKVQV